MKTLAMALFTMSIATGCTVNGKSMFGLGSKSPTSTGSVASVPTDNTGASSVTGNDDDGYTGPPKMDVDCMREGYETQQQCDEGRHRGKLEGFVRKLESLAGAKVDPDGYEQKRCTHEYEELVKAGYAPSTKVTVKGQSGTIQAFEKKHCTDAWVARQQQTKVEEAADLAARQAPFKKLLKNDKLEMAAGFKRPTYWVDSSGPTNDPAKLAKANVWFWPSQKDGYCESNGGPRYSLNRYTFDGNHKLVKDRTDWFCGEPPDSAYR